MKKQIHLHPDDLKKSDQMGLTYNLGQAHKRMLLKQSSIMKKYGSPPARRLSSPTCPHIKRKWSPRRYWKTTST